MIVTSFCLSYCQVCLTDYNDTDGENVKVELSSRFGRENVDFYKCDVSNDSELEGKRIIDWSRSTCICQLKILYYICVTVAF